jgi:hypothetical protein
VTDLKGSRRPTPHRLLTPPFIGGNERIAPVVLEHRPAVAGRGGIGADAPVGSEDAVQSHVKATAAALGGVPLLFHEGTEQVRVHRKLLIRSLVCILKKILAVRQKAVPEVRNRLNVTGPGCLA